MKTNQQRIRKPSWRTDAPQHSSKFWMLTFGSGYSAVLAAVASRNFANDGDLSMNMARVLVTIFGVHALVMGILIARKIGRHDFWEIRYSWGWGTFVGFPSLMLILTGLGFILWGIL